MRLLAAILLCLTVAFVACGDDDDAPGGSSSPAPTGSSTTSTATPTPGGSDAPSPSPTDPGSEPTLPPGQTYVVQLGDTLYSVAQRFGTTVDAIAAANGIDDPTQINAGDVLVIPGGGPATQPTEPPVTAPPATGGAPATVLRIGNQSRNAVAFTFDAGSDAGYTAQILDTLAANGITASFGMTGRWAETYPDLLRRIVADGHTLINHTYDHKSFTGNSTGATPLTQAERWEELRRTEQIVADLTGATMQPFFRPPYGDYDDSVNADVGAIGYSYNVMWTVDSRGWMGYTAEQIVQRCTDLAEPGAIYVFHVGSASQDGPALQQLIDNLRAAAYTIGDINAVLG